MSAEWIEISVPDASPMSAYVSRPASVGTAAIVVCHELFAVNADIRGAADRLASRGYLTVAPQFYHRWAPARVELARDDEGRAAGFGYLHQVTRDYALADMRAVLDYLGDRPVGVLGFSAGGHLAYFAATQLPIMATAVLYGGWLPSTDIPLSQPSPTLELTPGIAEHDGALLYLVGGRDSLIPEPAREQIRTALRQAGVRHELVAYPNAEHAFFWEGTPSYDAAATHTAWGRLFEFFDRELAS